jgi:superfamily II DNA/RNA helicase
MDEIPGLTQKLTCIESVRLQRSKPAKLTRDSKSDDLGRTGRFGRQGIAVNFVSDPGSWQAVQDLKSDLGRDIVKVATGDFDEMEKVRLRLSVSRTCVIAHNCPFCVAS